MQIRLYRVRWFFEHLEFNLTVSLLWSTLARNLTVLPRLHCDYAPHRLGACVLGMRLRLLLPVALNELLPC